MDTVHVETLEVYTKPTVGKYIRAKDNSSNRDITVVEVISDMIVKAIII